MISTKTLLLILTYACKFAVKSARGNSCDYMLIDVVDSDTAKFVVTNGASMMVFTVSLTNHAFPVGAKYMIGRCYLESLKTATSRFKAPQVFIYPLGADVAFTGDENHSVPTSKVKFPDYDNVCTNGCLLFKAVEKHEDVVDIELAIAPIGL